MDYIMFALRRDLGSKSVTTPEKFFSTPETLISIPE